MLSQQRRNSKAVYPRTGDNVEELSLAKRGSAVRLRRAKAGLKPGRGLKAAPLKTFER